MLRSIKMDACFLRSKAKAFAESCRQAGNCAKKRCATQDFPIDACIAQFQLRDAELPCRNAMAQQRKGMLKWLASKRRHGA